MNNQTKALVPQWVTYGTPSDNQGALDYAKRRFFESVAWCVVFAECAIPQSTWYKNLSAWRREKESVDDALVAGIRLKAIGKHCEDLARDSLQIVARTLRHLNENEVILEPKDLKVISEIASGMWKISQVEKGKATSIAGIETMSPAELVEFLSVKAKAFSHTHGSIIDLELEE